MGTNNYLKNTHTKFFKHTQFLQGLISEKELMQMIEMVEGGDMSKVAEMTNRPAQRPIYKERSQAPTSYVYSSNNNNNALKPFTERAQKELGQPFVSLRQEVQPAPQPLAPRPPAQSYSYFNMKPNTGPANMQNIEPRPTAMASPTTTTTEREREREEQVKPELTEVHRAPFFQGLNLENPFKNEFDVDFEMTKHIGFPSFATQLDYDYNPYDSPPTKAAPLPPAPAPPLAPAPRPIPPPRTEERPDFVSQLEAFTEDDIGRPPPGPTPPPHLLVKVKKLF